MADVQDVVDQWLMSITARWIQALESSPPDLFHTKDMPPLPEGVSRESFAKAVRNRILAHSGRSSLPPWIVPPDEFSF